MLTRMLFMENPVVKMILFNLINDQQSIFDRHSLSVCKRIKTMFLAIADIFGSELTACW